MKYYPLYLIDKLYYFLHMFIIIIILKKSILF